MARKGVTGWPAFEIGVGLVLAACVLAVVATRIDTILEQAEKTAVETTIMNLRSGLRLEKARRIVAGQGMAGLAGSNPLDLLQPPAGNNTRVKILNLLNSQNSDKRWGLSSDNTLYYSPNRVRHLKLQRAGAEKTLAWQLRADQSGGQVEFVSITPYLWF
jgi:hypothetical protein